MMFSRYMWLAKINQKQQQQESLGISITMKDTRRVGEYVDWNGSKAISFKLSRNQYSSDVLILQEHRNYGEFWKLFMNPA